MAAMLDEVRDTLTFEPNGYGESLSLASLDEPNTLSVGVIVVAVAASLAVVAAVAVIIVKRKKKKNAVIKNNVG